MIDSIGNDRLLVVTESKLIFVAAKILDVLAESGVLAFFRVQFHVPTNGSSAAVALTHVMRSNPKISFKLCSSNLHE